MSADSNQEQEIDVNQMLMDEYMRVMKLHAAIRLLIDEAKSLAKADKPFFVRAWNQRRIRNLLARAEELGRQSDAMLEKIDLLRLQYMGAADPGEPVIESLRWPAPVEMRPRRNWVVAQWVVGIINAWGMVSAFASEHWVVGSISLFCLAVVAKWRLPEEPVTHTNAQAHDAKPPRPDVDK